MSGPLFQIGGLASGLDTTSIISQLMQLERQPVRRFESRQAELRKVDAAWGDVTTSLSSVRSALEKVATPKKLDELRTVTSSHPEAVEVAKSGTPAMGNLSLTVDQLASTHQVGIGGYASADDKVGAGTFTVQNDAGETVSVTTDAETTLGALANQLRKAGGKVMTAQVVQVGEGDVRLLLTAKVSGTDGALTVGQRPGAMAAETEVQAAADAKLTIGSGPGALSVTRSSNTVDDVVEGLTLELRQVSEDPVTIVVDRDTDGVVENTKTLVQATQAALQKLRDLTAYNSETGKAGVLQGDTTARGIIDDLRRSMSSSVAGSNPSYPTLSSIGISVDRYGAVSLDETKLRAALADDFDAVTSILTSSSEAADAAISVASVGETTRSGTYAVDITQPATQARAVDAGYNAPLFAQDLTIAVGGRTVIAQLPGGASIDEAVSSINAALAAAGVSSLTASADGGDLVLQSETFGASGNFTVTDPRLGGFAAATEGQDVRGTFTDADGTTLAATGSGRRLTGTQGGADGLTIRVTATAAGAYGDVVVDQGLTGILDTALERTEGLGGSITRARDFLDGRIRDLDDQIAAFEVRLESREITLRRQFAGLESAMARLTSQGNWLAQQLPGLNANQ